MKNTLEAIKDILIIIFVLMAMFFLTGQYNAVLDTNKKVSEMYTAFKQYNIVEVHDVSL